MGDSRFRLKVNFSIYGEDYEWDASLNWSEDSDTGVDHNIVEWFRESYRDAHYKYLEDARKANSEHEKKETGKKERALLAHLKTKYES